MSSQLSPPHLSLSVLLQPLPTTRPRPHATPLQTIIEPPAGRQIAAKRTGSNCGQVKIYCPGQYSLWRGDHIKDSEKNPQRLKQWRSSHKIVNTTMKMTTGAVGLVNSKEAAVEIFWQVYRKRWCNIDMIFSVLSIWYLLFYTLICFSFMWNINSDCSSA